MRLVLGPPGVLHQGRRHTCRAFSTSRVVADSQPRLPHARLRALISLYHHSSTFITPATLSERIDLAFTDPANSQSLSLIPTSHSELQAQLIAKRNENKVGPTSKVIWKGVPLDLEGHQQWSDQRGARQTQVGAALWGTEWDGKPSLETVLETSSSDKESSSQLAATGNGEENTGFKSR